MTDTCPAAPRTTGPVTPQKVTARDHPHRMTRHARDSDLRLNGHGGWGGGGVGGRSGDMGLLFINEFYCGHVNEC